MSFLLVLVFLAQIAEFFIPPLEWMYNAHIYIVPMIVFYGAMALPFPLMLALAFFAGFLLDALTVQVLGARVEIALGWSILLYAVLAAIMHGLRPLFIRGRWEMHCIISGICTSVILLAQYLMITFRRGSIVFTREAWWQIGGPGVIAMFMAPLMFWVLHWMARATGNPYLPRRGLMMNRPRISPRCAFNFSRCSCCSAWVRLLSSLVGPGGAWPGMDRPDSRQLGGDGAHPVGSR